MLLCSDALNVIHLPVVTHLRPVERAWIHMCAQQAYSPNEEGPLATLTWEAYSDLVDRGDIASCHVAILDKAGACGRPPSPDCAIARRLWDEAMNALEAELLSMGALIPIVVHADAAVVAFSR